MELEKRGKFYWVIFYDLDRVRHRKSTKQTTLEGAKRVGRELERAAQTAASPQANKTIEQVSQEWLAHGCAGIQAQTLGRYTFHARHLAEHLGTVLVHRLTKAQVREYQTVRVGEKAAPGTIRLEMMVLKQVLKYAKDAGWTQALPADVVPAWKGGSAPRKRWLTYDEMVKLTATLKPEWAFWCWISVYTSARAAEVHELRWSDLDTATKRLHIRGTKSAGSDRWVAVPQPLWDMLMVRPPHKPGDHIVKKWYPANRSETLRARCKALGLAPIRAHDLRRTYASWLVQKGVSSLVVGKLMGHGDSVLVDKTYGHHNQEHLDAAARQLDSMKDTATNPLYEDAKEP